MNREPWKRPPYCDFTNTGVCAANSAAGTERPANEKVGQSADDLLDS